MPALALWVAPLAGAWIETLEKVPILGNLFVAPLAGAWIETEKAIAIVGDTRASRTPRGCVD